MTKTKRKRKRKTAEKLGQIGPAEQKINHVFPHLCNKSVVDTVFIYVKSA